MMKVMKPQCSSRMSSALEGRESDDERSNVIEGLLHEAMPSIKKADAERLARQLSVLLHKQSPHISIKGSLAKEHLKRLSMRILRLAREKRRPSLSLVDATEEISRQDCKKKALFPQNTDTDAKVERHHRCLINVVGEAKYDEIDTITKKIKDIRKCSSLWTQYSHRFVDSVKLDERLPASKGLPSEIYDVYFRIKLLNVMAVLDMKSSATFEETSQPCACIVNKVDWDHLLCDAKEKLDAFRKLERESSMSPELTFQCRSGSCHRQL